ncbi:MAG: hypothetical protein ABR579_00320 [Actinomycetota bacterium]
MNRRLTGFLVSIVATLATVAIVRPTASQQAAASRTHFSWKTTKLPAAKGHHKASFGEPTIVASAPDTLIVVAARANVGFPTMWVSRNDGVNWGRGKDFDKTGAMTGDDDVQVGADGFLYALNLAFNNPPAEPTNPTVQVFRSRHWRKWHGPATFPSPHGQDQPDRPWLVTDPSDPAHVWVFNSEGAGDVVVWNSDDHAHTFTGPASVTGAQQAGSIELTSRPLLDPSDSKKMSQIYEASAAGAPDIAVRDFPVTQLWLARSEDGGATWTNSMIFDMAAAEGTGGSLGHIVPSSAIDADGNLYVVFSMRLDQETTTHVYLIHSTDDGVTWRAPSRIDPKRLGSNVLPALAVGAPGKVDISWYGSRVADFTNDHARWVEMFAQSVDALSDHPSFVRGRISGRRPVHVGSINSAGNPGSNVYDWDLRDFQGITLDRCGMAHVAWTDDRKRGKTFAARQIGGRPVITGSAGCNG